MAFTNKTIHHDTREYIEEYYVSGAAAINESLAISKDLVIKEVRLHLGTVATQETFSLTLDSGKGAAYDVKLFSWDMSYDVDGNPGVVRDLIWRPESEARVDKDDSVAFAWTNTDACTWGLSVFVDRKES